MPLSSTDKVEPVIQKREERTNSSLAFQFGAELQLGNKLDKQKTWPLPDQHKRETNPRSWISARYHTADNFWVHVGERSSDEVSLYRPL